MMKSVSERNESRGPGRPPGTTHDAIRDIAIDLFLRDGYASTSLASIATAVGISRTTLFSYFRSKRDLIWEDHNRRTADVERTLAERDTHPVADLIVQAMLANARYDISEHAILAARMRIVEQDTELRAFSALATRELTTRILAGVLTRIPDLDPELVGMVTRALAAAASQCTEQWAAQDHPTASLDAYIADRVSPIVDALRPLLP